MNSKTVFFLLLSGLQSISLAWLTLAGDASFSGLLGPEPTTHTLLDHLTMPPKGNNTKAIPHDRRLQGGAHFKLNPLLNPLLQLRLHPQSLLQSMSSLSQSKSTLKMNQFMGKLFQKVYRPVLTGVY